MHLDVVDVDIYCDAFRFAKMEANAAASCGSSAADPNAVLAKYSASARAKAKNHDVKSRKHEPQMQAQPCTYKCSDEDVAPAHPRAMIRKARKEAYTLTSEGVKAEQQGTEAAIKKQLSDSTEAMRKLRERIAMLERQKTNQDLKKQKKNKLQGPHTSKREAHVDSELELDPKRPCFFIDKEGR